MKKAAPAPLTLDAMRARNTIVRMRCTLWVFLQSLSKAERKIVRQAIDDPTIQASAIARTLRERGFKSTELVLTRHRRQTCVTCDALP